MGPHIGPGRALPEAGTSRSHSGTERGESRSPATTMVTRCGLSALWWTSSVRTSTRCRTTSYASPWRQRSPASSPGRSTRPVVLEEFGLSSDFASDENAAHYYRQVLHTSLIAGAKGWLAWNNCDYDDLRDQDPYRHHPFEMHFGLTDKNGKPKPQLAEIARFSRLVADLDETGWEPIAGEVAIVVPEHFERVLLFTTVDYRKDIRDNLLQAYIAAREADLPVTFVRELDGFGEAAKLFLLPSAKLLMAPSAERLVELAEGGATVYLSYFPGSAPSQIGPWVPWLGELFGIRHQLRYGLVDPIEDDEVVFTFVEDLGDLTAGDELRFKVAGTESSRAFLPVEPAGATVLAARRARAPRAVTPTDRRWSHGAVHPPDRAHGGACTSGQPGEHVALVLGARHFGRRRQAT